MEREMESGKKLRRRDGDEIFPLSEKERVILNSLGQKELRITNALACDTMRSVGRMKIWNSYPPNEFEKIFTEQGLIPIGYYYSTYDVDTNELVFLSQDNYVTKRITSIRWKINKWFVTRGW